MLAASYRTQLHVLRKRRGRNPVVNKETTLLAVDVIEASANPVIQIADLARITSISVRSPRSGFHKYLGMSPTRYMQLETLNRARQRLSTAGPGETTVR